MRTLISILALAALPFSAAADTVTDWQAEPTRVFATDEVALNDLEWQLRALVVFRRGENDPLFLG